MSIAIEPPEIQKKIAAVLAKVDREIKRECADPNRKRMTPVEALQRLLSILRRLPPKDYWPPLPEQRQTAMEHAREVAWAWQQVKNLAAEWYTKRQKGG